MKKKRKVPHKYLLKKLRTYTNNDTWKEIASYFKVESSTVSMWLKRNRFPKEYWDEATTLSDGEITNKHWRGLR